MQQIPSVSKNTVSRLKKPVDKPYFGTMHGISHSIPIFQAQLACKPDPLRFNNVFLAITRLLSAQAEYRR